MVPILPPKTFLSNNTTNAFIKERTAKLDIYLQQLCILPGASLLPALRSFVNDIHFSTEAEPTAVRAMGRHASRSRDTSLTSSPELMALSPPKLHMMHDMPPPPVVTRSVSVDDAPLLSSHLSSGASLPVKPPRRVVSMSSIGMAGSINLTVEQLDNTGSDGHNWEEGDASSSTQQTPPTLHKQWSEKMAIHQSFLDTPPKPEERGNGISYEQMFSFDLDRSRSGSVSSATGAGSFSMGVPLAGIGGTMPCRAMSPGLNPKAGSDRTQNMKPYFSHHGTSGNLLIF